MTNDNFLYSYTFFGLFILLKHVKKYGFIRTQIDLMKF